MKRRIAFLINVFVIIVLLAPYGIYAADTNKNGSIFIPLVQRNYLGDPQPVIPDTTEVLDETTIQHLSSVSEDGITFSFSQSTPELEELEPGDVIVGDPTDETPDGFLRSVESIISQQSGQIIIKTEDATIEDAIQSGAIHESIALTPEDINESSYLEGVTLRTNSPDQLGFSYSLDVVLFDLDDDLGTTNDQIRALGDLNFDSKFNFDLVVRDWEIEQLTFTNTVTETAQLTIDADFEYSIHKEKEIAKHKFQSIKFSIGVVPVWITPVISIFVGADGSFHAGMTVEVTQEASLTAGLKFYKGDWSPVSDFNNEFHIFPPILEASLFVKGYAGIELSMMLYGVVGPHIGVTAYLKLEADIQTIPWWSLYAGLEVPAGVKVEVLGKSLADYEIIVINYEKLLLKANSPPNAPMYISPEDGAIDQSINLILSWTGGDPDDDDVTYDVFLEPDDPDPDYLVSPGQSPKTYDPSLEYDTHYYWKIISTDEHGLSKSSPVWEFTTGSTINSPPNPPSYPIPTDGAMDQDINVDLSWTGGDPDLDEVWFDIYFEAGDPDPELFMSDHPGESFDPGPHIPNTHYYWKIIARDIHGLESEGPVWDFTTRDETALGTWEEVGEGSATGVGISDNVGDSGSSSIAINLYGIPYITWEDDTSGDSEIYVRRWNGTIWEELGAGSASGGGISNNNDDSDFPSIALGQDGTPYITWEDISSGDTEIYVQRWNGSAWEELGAGSASGGGISNNNGSSRSTDIALAPDGTPYITWTDISSGDWEIYVRRWNGSIWEEVGFGSASGGGISNNNGFSYNPSISIASDGMPYITWEGWSGDYEIYVKRWNGSTWEEVGGGSASGGGISNNNGSSHGPSIALTPDGTPYITWSDRSSGDPEIYVRRWNGAVWEELGAGSASGGGISNNKGSKGHSDIAISPDGTPYITWHDYSSGDGEIYVRRWIGE